MKYGHWSSVGLGLIQLSLYFGLYGHFLLSRPSITFYFSDKRVARNFHLLLHLTTCVRPTQLSDFLFGSRLYSSDWFFPREEFRV